VRYGVEKRRGQQVDGLPAVKRDLVGRGGLSRLPASASSTAQIDALLDDPQWRPGRLEVGWAVLSSFRKRGMATEIGRSALSFAADELNAGRVIAFTEPHNLASRRVMEKLGMAVTGEIRARGLVQGKEEEQDDAPFVVYATPEADVPGRSVLRISVS
jgi:RimJ/RimL family protein N-acetyltransferase